MAAAGAWCRGSGTATAHGCGAACGGVPGAAAVVARQLQRLGDQKPPDAAAAAAAAAAATTTTVAPGRDRWMLLPEHPAPRGGFSGMGAPQRESRRRRRAETREEVWRVLHLRACWQDGVAHPFERGRNAAEQLDGTGQAVPAARRRAPEAALCT